MIFPVALISTCFLISASLGSEETCHPLEDECETITVQRYFEKRYKKDAELLKCRTDLSELQKRYSDFPSEDLEKYSQISKCQQDYSDLVKSHLEVLSQLKESEVKYEQMINQKNGEMDLLKNQISDLKKTSDLAMYTNLFREEIAKLEKKVKMGGIHENNLTKSEVKTGELPTTPLHNINNQTTPKTETIDFPDLCPRSQANSYVVREIQLPGSDPFKVVCMSDSELGSRWLNVYRKYDDSKTFNRTYEDYQRGFGEAGTGEFFIGLNRLHNLASGKPHEVVLYAGWGIRRCDHFVVGDRSEGYKLNTIGNCTGDDWMSPKQGSQFSTFDQDEDGDPDRNLAKEVGYGWWFDPGMSHDKNDIEIFIRRTD